MLPLEEEKPNPSTLETPRVELSPIQKGLKHAFLGHRDTFLVIFSFKLVAKQDEKLKTLLREHKFELGWTLVDIKGISPLICTHRIHLEEGAQPY